MKAFQVLVVINVSAKWKKVCHLNSTFKLIAEVTKQFAGSVELLPFIRTSLKSTSKTQVLPLRFLAGVQ